MVGSGDHGDPLGVGLGVDPAEDAPEGGVDVAQHRQGLRRAEELVVGGGVRLVEPDERHLGAEPAQDVLGENGRRVVDLLEARQVARGQRAEAGDDLVHGLRRLGVVAPCDRERPVAVCPGARIDQVGGPRRSGVDHGEPLARRRELVGEGRRRDEAAPGRTLGEGDVGGEARVEHVVARRLGEEERVPDDAVHRGRGARGDGGRGDAGHGREHAARLPEPGAAPRETDEVRGQLGRHHVRAQAVEDADDDAVGTRHQAARCRLVRARPASAFVAATHSATAYQ